jgi:hypothetical protein
VSRQVGTGVVIDALAVLGSAAVVVGAWAVDWRAGLVVVGIGCLCAAVTLARR